MKNEHLVITATEAARNLSEVLSRVAYQQAHYEITRGGEAIAQIIPAPQTQHSILMKDLNDFLQTLPKLDAEDVIQFRSDIDCIREQMKSGRDLWD